MSEDIYKIRVNLSRLADVRPHDVELRELSPYVMPGKLEMILGGLIWRAEELARNAFDLLMKKDFVTSAIITRALMETAGCLVLIHNLVNKSIEKGLSASFDSKINKLLFGSILWEDLDKPIHVNDMLREVQKVIPDYFDVHYASLSEYAHPNWLGTFGAYGTTHKEETAVSFSDHGASAERQHGTILGRLSGTIVLCLGYHEMVREMMGDFVKSVDIFYAVRPEI